MKLTAIMLLLIVGCDAAHRDELSIKWISSNPEERGALYVANDKHIINYLVGKDMNSVREYLGAPNSEEDKTEWIYDLHKYGDGKHRWKLIIQYDDKGIVRRVTGDD